MRKALEVALAELDLSLLIASEELVLWGQASAEPVALTSRLIEQAPNIARLRAFVGISWTESVSPAHLGMISYQSYCGAGNNRRLGDALDILPCHYSHIANTLAKERPILLLQLAPGSDAECFSFGAAQEYLADLLPYARLVIGQVNRQAPRTFGGRELRRNQIDILVHADTPLANDPAGDPAAGPVERAIAGHVAGLVQHGATLQMGIGNIPRAVLMALSGHRDLGIHSGLIDDAVIPLIEAGVITNARKSIDAGLTVTGLLAGTDRLFAWADRNRQLALRPTSYTHAQGTLKEIDCFTAINSAIEVDLTGQINAEVASGRYVGAVGGAGDFLRGAHASSGGLPIVALPSTARGLSRIVARLGGPATVARADAGIIVTEHGIADLRGLSIARRREAMLAIAAPELRDAIEADLTTPP